MNLIVFVAIFSAVIFVAFQGFKPITGTKQKLGDMTYDMVPTNAPVAKSTLLKVLSYIITKSRFGPVVARFLLDDNNIADLRELSAQIQLPPLYFPLRRYDAEEIATYYSEADLESFERALASGVTSAALQDSHGRLRSIEDYANFYKAGNKPSDVIKRTLAAIRSWEKQGYKIFSEVQQEEVLRQAYESDGRHAAGKPLSIFDGVPVAFKDSMQIKGHTTLNGQSPAKKNALYHLFGDKDDIMVSRFRAAGGIVMGLTLMVEGGVTPVGFNAHVKGPISTYSWNRYSGGSSSGSAVAVTTGLVPVAIGFDGGGSIRVPATMSGVFGLATSFARCPFDSDHDSTVIKTGPIAANAADAAIAMAIMAPNAPNHRFSKWYDGGINGPPKAHIGRFNDVEDLSDVRIGIYPEYFNDSQPYIRDRGYKVIDYLKSRGATVIEIKIPHLQSMTMAHGTKIASEFALGFDRGFHDDNSLLEPNTRITTALGSTVTALEGLASERLRHYGFNYVTSLIKEQRLSAIITPTIGIDVPILSEDAKELGESNTAMSLALTKHIFLGNLLGLPGLSVPMGFLKPSMRYESEPEELTLPVGIQLIGDHWSEHELLRIGHAIEQGFTRKLNDPYKLLFSHDPLAK